MAGHSRKPAPLPSTLMLAVALAASGCAAPLTTSSTAASPHPAPPTAVARSAGPTSSPELVTSDASGSTPSARVASSTAAVPSFSHIYVIVMENHEYGSIVGNSHAPYLNALIRRYGLATNYHAVTHPSLPNYLALFAGSTFGIRDDGIHNLTARNLVDQLAAHGRTWHVYAQDLPSRCFTGASARGGVDLVGVAGWYARKHEPAISFTDISHNATRCAKITHLAEFSPTAASFELIVPNMTNDMHDGTVAQGDAFLRAFVPRITGSGAFARSLLVITWDEGSTSLGGGGHVATIVISPAVRAGFRSSIAHTHDSLLRTVEDAWGLGCLNRTCTANDLGEFFAP
jgi:phosphatidylinositol-3-phosphatase